MTRVQIIGFFISILIIAFVVEQVRRRKIAVEYSLMWIAAGLAIALLSVWKGSIEEIAGLMGIVYSPSAVFAVFGIIILVICINFSFIISHLSKVNRVLVQRVALLEEEFSELEKNQQIRVENIEVNKIG